MLSLNRKDIEKVLIYQIFILSEMPLTYSKEQKTNQAASIVRTLFSSLGQKSRLARRKS